VPSANGSVGFCGLATCIFLVSLFYLKSNAIFLEIRVVCFYLSVWLGARSEPRIFSYGVIVKASADASHAWVLAQELMV
jgi:hypothetical protein